MNGGPPSPDSVFFVGVAPGWFGVMKIPLFAGRDFRSSDTSPKFAIVNEAFAKRYCPGENPVGKLFNDGVQIVGMTVNASYDDIHDPVPPVAYVPSRYVDTKGIVQPEGVRGVLLSVGQEDGRLRHDGGGYHALAPVVDLVVVETAFSQAEEFDHVGARETDGVCELPLDLSLVQGDFQ